MNTEEKALIEKVQQRIVDGMLTSLEHELFNAWLKELNRNSAAESSDTGAQGYASTESSAAG